MRKKLKTKKVMWIIYLKNRKIYVRGLKMQVLRKTVVYSKRIMRAPVNDACKGPLPFSSKSNSIMYIRYIDVERFVSNQLILGLANFELLF